MRAVGPHVVKRPGATEGELHLTLSWRGKSSAGLQLSPAAQLGPAQSGPAAHEGKNGAPVHFQFKMLVSPPSAVELMLPTSLMGQAG